MEPYEATNGKHTGQPSQQYQHPPSSDDDDAHAYSQNPIKLEAPDSIVPLTNILNELVQLKYFLLTGPAQLRTQDGIHRHTLPNKEQISCVVWKNVYFITGTDIVRCLSFRFEAFGREISNRKKFEEGIFSDLRNLKCDNDAVLEQPKSEFLDFLYRNSCVRTQKKQKIFYWFSVNHDRLFQDALERDLKKELTKKKSSTTPVRDPAISFQYDGSRTLHDQLPDIIEKFPRPLAELADASSIMSNLPISTGHMMPPMPPQFPPSMPYQMMPPGEVPIMINQSPVLQSNGMQFYVPNPEMILPSEGMMIPIQHPQPPGQYVIPYQMPTHLPPNAQPNPQLQAFVPPPPSLSAPLPASTPNELPLFEEPAEPIEDQSDFPLDYVDPSVNQASLPSQLYEEPPRQPATTTAIVQGYYYADQQYADNMNGQVTTQEYIQAPYPDEQTYKTVVAADPAITYDSQQFEVVYHQDETGAYTSTMVPTSSAVDTSEDGGAKRHRESAATTLPPDQQDQKTTPIQMQQSVSHHASPRLTSPKKPVKIKDETIPRPSSAGSLGSSHMHTALQAKKLHSKITKQSQTSNPSLTRVKIPNQGYDRSDFHSATYFMPTPSESGCSDLTPFPQDHEFVELHSPAVGNSFSRSVSRSDMTSQPQDMQGHHHPHGNGVSYVFKSGKPVSVRRGTLALDISRQAFDPHKRSMSNSFQSPARSDFDDPHNTEIIHNTSEESYAAMGPEEGYIYTEQYAQEGANDWI